MTEEPVQPEQAHVLGTTNYQQAGPQLPISTEEEKQDKRQ